MNQSLGRVSVVVRDYHEALDPTQIAVRGHNDLGDYYITGEVVNGLDDPIHNVELEVVYRGSYREELAREGAAVVLTRAEPGGTAPFIAPRYAARQ